MLTIYEETNGVIFFLLFLYGLSNIALSFVFIPLFKKSDLVFYAYYIFSGIAIILSSYIPFYVDTSVGVKWSAYFLSPVALGLGLKEVCVLRPLIILGCKKCKAAVFSALNVLLST